jgi:Autotransporter beta-domain
VDFGTGSALDVEQGADWIASGNWTVASVNNAGVLQPGIIGAPLNLTGDFSQGATGTLRVVVTPSETSQFNVAGAVRLGGNLVYVLAPGAYAPRNTTFLTASGAVTGSFANVTATQAAQNQVDPAPAPVAVALASGGHGADLVVTQGFVVTPADDALFADAAQAMVQDTQLAGDVLLGHAVAANTEPCPAAGALRGNADTQAGIAEAIAGAFCNAGGWLQASGTRMDAQGGYDAQNVGFLAGIDRVVNGGGTRLGLAVGYDDTTLADKSGGKARVGTARVGVYGTQPIGRFVLLGEVMGGFASENTTRVTGAGYAGGRANGRSISGGLDLARQMSVQGVTLLPAAGVRFASAGMGGLSETAQNSAFALRVGAAGETSVQPFLNLAAGYRFITAAKMVVTPQLGAGVAYEAGNRAVTVTAADGSSFAAGAKRLDPAEGQFSAGVSAGRGNWSLDVRYAALVSGNWSSQTVEAGVQARF